MSFETVSDELRTLQQQKKEIERQITSKKTEFFNLARSEVSVTAVGKLVEVPNEFFTSTQMTESEFLETRYPSWVLEERIANENSVAFHLKKNPDFIPYVYVNEDGKYKVAKEIQEYDPKIDFDSLRNADPDLFNIIIRETTGYELDEVALEHAIQEIPEVLSILSRHLVMKVPAQKMSPFRELKNV